MKQILAVFRRELYAYFTSPIAYAVISIFVIISGYFFYALLRFFVQMSFRAFEQSQMYGMAPPTLNVNEMLIRGLMQNLAVIALFIIPLITMRLVAEEKRNGTIELLMTSPLTETRPARINSSA